MIAVQEALKLVLSEQLPQETETVDLAHALGRVLAEPVLADRDAPPFHRVTMDGIAVRASALANHAAFRVEKIQAAGQAPLRLDNDSHCIEVMTGAVLPKNTDCVIPYEQVTMSDGLARPHTAEYQAFQNVHRQGTDAAAGEVLLEPGKVISPGIVGLMASVGLSRVKVLKMPAIAVCSTGDELVDLDQTPEIHQIRKSNAYMLQAALLDAGLLPDVFHLKDDQDAMREALAQLVQKYRVILFSGAVSRGKFDFLPDVLQDLGMRKTVHGVAQRPGKPFLFGRFSRSLIFGFPGNPASTLVCFHTYFKPWLWKHFNLSLPEHSAILTEDVKFSKPLTYHLLVTLKTIQGSLRATPISTSGSGDLVHLAQADGIVCLPAEKDYFYAGESYPLIPFYNQK